MVIAIVLSVFAARLVQLQGIDPNAYAQMAAEEALDEVVLPAERGAILDRNDVPLADSVAGKMVIADPQMTRDKANELAKILSTELGVDYFRTLEKLRFDGGEGAAGGRFQYIARRVPSTQATDLVEHLRELKFEGITTQDDPVRDYPAGEVAANVLGFMGTDEPLGGFERTFDAQLGGKDGHASYTEGRGYRVPLGESSTVKPVDGAPLRTTLDRDLQWFTQKVLDETLDQYHAESGAATVMDSRTGEILALADAPTYDPNHPLDYSKEDLGSRALSEPYEPGSVEKVLTVSSLIDAGKVTPRTKIRVPPSLDRQDRSIGDWWDHGDIRLTLAGVIAKSSNIGTVLATDQFTPPELTAYLKKFGLGEKTDVGVRGETRGILTPGEEMTSQTKDRVAFGQSLSVNAVQMTAAVNTIANGGVRIDPSLIRGSAVTDDGVRVGTDTVTERRVVSQKAAHQTMMMMERVVDDEVGVAPQAQVPGYRVAGKTGTAQRVDATCGCYDGSTSVSFAGFAPADDPRFTVYVVVHAPAGDGGGGSIGGPAFSRIMGYALSRYRVPPTGTRPSRLPVEW
ncbi:peptidoglycan D,D-transpeptidase FtsI family protein [Nocardioides sp. LHG3406-4]|uniref:peptidoglycan D,D-transpeptidase FtsI family protein n=1 Tax=Nocardioides sp. LHG3406-4 TaxID=2804575 RepID=UPI003CF76E0F